MKVFINQPQPDISALFSQFLAQLPAVQIEQLTGKANGLADLRNEQRSHVDTATAARLLLRRPQTLRGWHSAGAFPIDGLRPLSINGRLAWPVAAIKAVMGVS